MEIFREVNYIFSINGISWYYDKLYVYDWRLNYYNITVNIVINNLNINYTI